MNAPIFDPPNLPQCIKYLSALVSFNSASSDVPAADHGNEALIDWAMAELTAAGLTCRKIQTAPGKFNLIADTHPRLPLGLIFSGHSDTVPADPALWHSDPWTLTESCGMLYGLGACDMKGALACFMTAAAAAAELSRRMPDFFERGIRLLFTADEETSMQGAAAYAALSEPQAHLLVIGEPTALTPIVGHKGYAARCLTITGKAGHSSNPAGGCNALWGLQQALSVLKLMAWEFEQEQDEAYSVPYTTLNPGVVSGGEAVNQICAQVKLFFELRPIRPLPAAQLDELLQTRLQEGSSSGCTLELSTPYPDIPCFYQDRPQLEAYLAHLTKHACLKVNYCTEASLLQRCAHGTAVLGPGDIARAHQADEGVPIADLEGYLALLSALISDVCRAGGQQFQLMGDCM